MEANATKNKIKSNLLDFRSPEGVSTSSSCFWRNLRVAIQKRTWAYASSINLSLTKRTRGKKEDRSKIQEAVGEGTSEIGLAFPSSLPLSLSPSLSLSKPNTEVPG
jgi:hypothetical protein